MSRLRSLEEGVKRKIFKLQYFCRIQKHVLGGQTLTHDSLASLRIVDYLIELRLITQCIPIGPHSHAMGAGEAALRSAAMAFPVSPAMACRADNQNWKFRSWLSRTTPAAMRVSIKAVTSSTSSAARCDEPVRCKVSA